MDGETRWKRVARRPISWPLWRLLVLGFGSFFFGVCVATTPTDVTTSETTLRSEDVLPRVSTTRERTSITRERTTTSTTSTTAAPTTTTAATAPPQTPTPTQAFAAPPPSSNCHPSYPDFCIPPPPPDLDCGDIDQKDFTVHQPDPHGFDGNRDGRGCEN